MLPKQQRQTCVVSAPLSSNAPAVAALAEEVLRTGRVLMDCEKRSAIGPEVVHHVLKAGPDPLEKFQLLLDALGEANERTLVSTTFHYFYIKNCIDRSIYHCISSIFHSNTLYLHFSHHRYSFSANRQRLGFVIN